jgi:hypothetical protein
MNAHILDGFIPKRDFAEANGVTPRSVDRYRNEGLPWMMWGGKVFIGPTADARAWLEARVRRATGGRS